MLNQKDFLAILYCIYCIVYSISKLSYKKAQETPVYVTHLR